MSETFQEKLGELRKKHSSELTEADRAFLLARSSYLQEHELSSLGISTVQAEPVVEDQIIPEDEPVKSVKKPKTKVKTNDQE